MEIITQFIANQTWYQLAGEVVIFFTAITGALPDAWVARIPILGRLWPIFNWLAGNVFNNMNHPAGFAARKEIDALVDNAKKK